MYILSQLHNVRRVNVVWDELLTESLKAETCCKRGKGVRRWVGPSGAIPRYYPEYLHIDNKTELFSFLAKSVISLNMSDKYSAHNMLKFSVLRPRYTRYCN